MLFNLSRSLSLCVSRRKQIQSFFSPHKHKIISWNPINIWIDSTRRDQEISSLVRDKRDQKFCAQTNKKQTNKKKIFRFWMEAE